jgi:phosphoglycerate dehydrogenase-like enzyme
VVLTVPHTPDTEGMFDASKFELMKSSAVLINVGRGAVVKIDDLATALEQGVIGEATRSRGAFFVS